MEKMICAKQVFQSRRKAKQIAKKSSVRLYPYVCIHCNGWHITKQKQTTNTPGKRDIRINRRALVHMIQIRSTNACFLRRLSNRKTAWEIVLGNKKYNVIYNKKRQEIEELYGNN